MVIRSNGRKGELQYDCSNNNRHLAGFVIMKKRSVDLCNVN